MYEIAETTVIMTAIAIDIIQYFLFSSLSNGRFIFSLGENIKIIIVETSELIAKTNSTESKFKRYKSIVIKATPHKPVANW